MCRHCRDLSEDQEFVHRYMELTARRVSEKMAKDGIDPIRPITADDIDIRIEVNFESFVPNPLFREYGTHLLRDLEDMHK